MKFILCLLFSSLAVVSLGQLSSVVRSVNHQESVFFLDSIEIDPAITVFDPNILETLTVEYNVTKTQRRIYMISKNPKDYYFVSLAEIKDKYTKNATTPVLFMVNNAFLQNNISAYKIDTSYILNVELLRGSDIDNLKESLHNLTIVRINTKTKQNVEQASKNYYPGTEFHMIQ